MKKVRLVYNDNKENIEKVAYIEAKWSTLRQNYCVRFHQTIKICIRLLSLFLVHESGLVQIVIKIEKCIFCVSESDPPFQFTPTQQHRKFVIDK